MIVNETRHAYIDLNDEEVEKLNDVLSFLERLNDTINRLKNDNIEWDIRSIEEEDAIFGTIGDILYFANKLIG